MEKLPIKLINKLDTTTIRFQTEIINRIKLFNFSKSAILYYSESQKNQFKGYSFEKLKNQFKLVGFKKGSEIKSIKYNEIVSAGNSYIKGELSDSIFVLNMSTFEHWLLASLKTIILSNPRQYYPNNKKQIDVEYLKKFTDMQMFWEELVDDYLSNLPYHGMKNMLRAFLKCFGLKESNFTSNLVGMINENSQCRNLIIHNQKKVNTTYIRKCGKYGKFSTGDYIEINEQLLFNQADKLLRFMQDFRNNHG